MGWEHVRLHLQRAARRRRLAQPAPRGLKLRRRFHYQRRQIALDMIEIRHPQHARPDRLDGEVIVEYDARVFRPPPAPAFQMNALIHGGHFPKTRAGGAELARPPPSVENLYHTAA